MKKKIIILITLILFLPNLVYAYSDYIYVGGESIGIKLKSDGVLVIGFYKINGSLNNQGIEIGDYITKINDVDINNINDLINLINKEVDNDTINITINRNNKELNIDFKLIKENNTYKTGLYVKDSVNGIGTLTYVDPSNYYFGILGHNIILSETRTSFDIKEGIILDSKVTSISKSSDGSPGEKKAIISNDEIGSINHSSDYGLFGIYNANDKDTLMEVGKIEDLKLGKAYIRTELDDNVVSNYEINIIKINKNSKTKNIYFEITDEKLLNKTGGIVQGMSGSPIIQDNKIYGAVSHVIVDNVKTGYGIKITTMLEEGEN